MKNTYFCNNCQKDLPSYSFYIWFYTEEEMVQSPSKARRKWRRSDFCKLCSNLVQKTEKVYSVRRNRLHKLKIEDPLGFWAQTRCSECKQRAKKYNLPFNLNPQDLLNLWHDQRGLCFYTDEPLLIGSNSAQRNSVSVDRLNPSLGYIPSNIVLCTFRVNASKQELSEKDFYSYCQLILDKARDRDVKFT